MAIVRVAAAMVDSKDTLCRIMRNAMGGRLVRTNQHTIFTTTQPGNPGSVKPITPKAQSSGTRTSHLKQALVWSLRGEAERILGKATV